jgi:hypothetical protein
MMRDPELVARAQHAAARLESAWERWRALQGLGDTPAQPVVGYVGYALKEPWGQPRAVIGFSADEAERLAEFLEHGSAEARAEARPVPLTQQQLLPQQPLPQQPAPQQPAPQPAAPQPAAAVSATGGQPAVPSFTPATASRPTAGQPKLADLGAERSLCSLRRYGAVIRFTASPQLLIRNGCQTE